ncbi:MAG: helix-turn-helix domain-containing protein, partial [Candidatus Thorarchaeota archaeon]
MSDDNIILLKPEETIGDRFRLFREKIGKSREELAKEMKRSVELVKNIEKGRSEPPIICLYYFMETYKLDINWLLFGTSTPPQQEKLKGGLPPSLIKKYCKEREIPLKEHYDELLELLQVPIIYQFVFAKLIECKNTFKVEIKDLISSGP